MCLDFSVHEKQLWNGVIQQLLSFGLVSLLCRIHRLIFIGTVFVILDICVIKSKTIKLSQLFVIKFFFYPLANEVVKDIL